MKELTEPFREALAIIETIEEAGHQAFFVGGCVRDFLLKRPIGDVDITTSAKPFEVQAIFDEVIPVGIQHGTVIVRHRGISYEVTTFRVEGEYSDQRHPDSVQFIDKIDEDLARRDFTINALAMNKHGYIIDLFHGREDIEKALIRAVGNGHDRFQEDPLRILRAIRFSSQLGFQIEENTLKAIMATRQSITGLAVERITVELQKLFAGKDVKTALSYMVELRIDQELPVLKDYHLIAKLVPIIQPLHTLAEVLCLIHQMEPELDIRIIGKEWKCSNKILREAFQLNQAVDYYKANGLDNWLVYQLLPDYYNAFYRITEIMFPTKIDKDELYRLKKQLNLTSKKDLNINGNDIIKLFPAVPKGPWIQDKLVKLERLVVLGELQNNNMILKDWLKWNPPEQK
ncbi:CCA tRNA nucleotidyltransferase [Ornithinibacillus sp. BX22]|uniref:CCA-adding enzyme n=2 Tax=Ornithinibacillus TaxID=484508 RepID=A0A923L5X6_9BACI|nr:MULTISPECIES: CCA tRNA nucleotidyltransferase [Ornithinibacillus]MBC5637052.1 CCA tRNA nucleotidyltransferase [Ornithinibacillus hominis]MBS3679737.1 CCA tRNA nucleotidyltransferase [Ornithinibacillus massiliensis]